MIMVFIYLKSNYYFKEIWTRWLRAELTRSCFRWMWVLLFILFKPWKHLYKHTLPPFSLFFLVYSVQLSLIVLVCFFFFTRKTKWKLYLACRDGKVLHCHNSLKFGELGLQADKKCVYALKTHLLREHVPVFFPVFNALISTV